MFFVSFALILSVMTMIVVQKPAYSAGSVSLHGFDGSGVIAGFMIVIAVAAFLGLPFAIPVMIVFLLHELGNVLAHRMLGHQHTRFRLVPILSDVKVSDEPLKTDGEEFFVAIMGPALTLAPMTLAMALASALATSMPGVANFLWMFVVASGTLNFIGLLPFLPLNGGRCVRVAVVDFWPALAPAMTVFMCAAMGSASLRTGSITLMIMAGIGAQSLLRRPVSDRATMGANAGLIALSAYAFTLAAHFSAGWLLFQNYF